MNYQDGFEFEKRCAAFLKTKGYHKITVTPPSGDQGIDIIAYKSGLKYGIQCKYYSAPVGNKAVQEAYSGARFYDCNRAAVMTNHTFTKAARELADKLEVELWDYCNPTVQTDFFRKVSCVFLLLFLLAGISAGISMLIFEYFREPEKFFRLFFFLCFFFRHFSCSDTVFFFTCIVHLQTPGTALRAAVKKLQMLLERLTSKYFPADFTQKSAL